MKAPQGCEEEYCDLSGAREIADRIEAYWAAKGYLVQPEIYNSGFSTACRAARYDIRSQMRNGLPPGVKVWNEREQRNRKVRVAVKKMKTNCSAQAIGSES